MHRTIIHKHKRICTYSARVRGWQFSVDKQFDRKMFSDDFLMDVNDSTEAKETPARPRSPPHSYEEWMSREGITQWPLVRPSSAEDSIPPESILGTLEDIKEDLKTHAPWNAEFLASIGDNLDTIEGTLSQLAGSFCPGPAPPESVAGGIAIIKDMAFLTEICDTDLLSSRRVRKRNASKDSSEGKTVEYALYPGISVGSRTVPFPGGLDALPVLDLVTKSSMLPLHIIKSWQKTFFSEASCSLLQNTFWYVWMSYFRPKPDPVEQSKLFGLISEDFVSLLHSMELKHKDEVFVHYSDRLAQAVYSSFCHIFISSNTLFNSDHFLSFLTNLTSEWITGVGSLPGSWRSWPLHLLNPYHSIQNKGGATATEREGALKTSFDEKDVMRLSLQDKAHTRKRRNKYDIQTARSQKVTAKRVVAKASNMPKDEDVGIGPGPTFECVRFSLIGRSPLLQHFLVTHGLVEERTDAELSRAAVGRTQIKELPPPSVSYKQLLQASGTVSKRNYSKFERDMEKTDQEISATRMKHHALLRASDRRSECLLKHRNEVAALAEKIMAKYRSIDFEPAKTNSLSPPK